MEIGLQAEEANDSDRRCSPATAEETDDSDCRCGPTATGPGLRVHSVQTVSTKLNLALTCPFKVLVCPAPHTYVQAPWGVFPEFKVEHLEAAILSARVLESGPALRRGRFRDCQRCRKPAASNKSSMSDRLRNCPNATVDSEVEGRAESRAALLLCQ
jgi:hypothetical protein